MRIRRRERGALQRAARRAGRLRDPPPGPHVPARARALPAVPDQAGRGADGDPVSRVRDRGLREPLPRVRGAARGGGGGRVHGPPRRLLRDARAGARRGADVGLAPALRGARRARGHRVRVDLREPRRRGRRDAAPPPRADLRLPVPAPRAAARARRRRAPRAAARRARCLRRELEDGRRVVYENEAVVAYVPYAARWPYEAHVVLREHRPSLLDCERRGAAPARRRRCRRSRAATTRCSTGRSPT